jgi:uncharacterized protein YbjT (DUF2867 family)
MTAPMDTHLGRTRIVVVGGSGLIGRRLVSILGARGHEVIAA